MYRTLTATVAALGMLGGVALASNHSTWLDDYQAQVEVQEWATGQPVDPWTPPADFALEPGQPLPSEAQTHAFTGFDTYPEAAGFEYVIVNGSTVVVDAETREIVRVID